MIRRDIVEKIVQYVMDDEDLTKHADQVARLNSKTIDVDLDTIEDTAQYGLYWASYAEEQARVIGLVQQKLFRYLK